MDKKSVIIGVVIAVFLAGFGYIYYSKSNESSRGIPAENILSSDKAAEQALNYINKILGQQGGSSAQIASVSDASGIYKLNLKSGEQAFDAYVSKDGKLLFPQAIDLEAESAISSAIGNFSANKKEEICSEDGKPVVYFFGSKSCPHCAWEHPIMEKVMKNFEGLVSFHNNMDSQADMEVFSKFSTGGIPAIVFGCKYYRVGSGEQSGEEQETEVLTSLACKLTNGNPLDVCQKVQNLIDQI